MPAGELVWPPRKEDLERMYVVERLSAAKIAAAYGLKYASPKTAESTVLHHLKKNGISRRDRTAHLRKPPASLLDEWVTRYEAGESLSQVAGDMFSPVTVWNHLRELGVPLRDKVEAQIGAVTKYERRSFNGDRLEKAYLMGLRYGDLDVKKHGRAVRVRLSTTHPAMADLFRNLFSVYGHILEYPRKSLFTGFEWSMECDLDGSFEFLLTRPMIDNIHELPADEFTAFLTGFFDAEGTVYLHLKVARSSPECHITNTDRNLLVLISERLDKQGLHPTIRTTLQTSGRRGNLPQGVIHRLHLWRRDEVRSFLTLLEFRHPEKIAKKALALEILTASSIESVRRVRIEWEKLAQRIQSERDMYVKSAATAFKERLGKKKIID